MYLCLSSEVTDLAWRNTEPELDYKQARLGIIVIEDDEP